MRLRLPSLVLEVDFYDDEVDDYFRDWLKAKFTDSRKAGQRFDGDYHREIFKSDMNESLKLDHNAAAVKIFLKGPFRYYADLYVRIWKAILKENSEYPAVFRNNLNEQGNQFMLILSACCLDDPEETEKIISVSAGIDRLFSLLQLQGAHDSNRFVARLFEISAEIREQPAEEIPAIFERHLIQELQDRRAIPDLEAFNYSLFRTMSIDRMNTRFTRYLFARVEEFLAVGMKQKMRQPFEDLVTKRGNVNGHHVEHILSRNEDNLELFDGDEELFEQQRNRLGGILLLKGRDNGSSGKEVFTDKLRSYSNTLLWNETLRADNYKSNLDFDDFAKKTGLNFRPLEKFGPKELDERQRLLFDICSKIWPSPIEPNT